MPMSPTGLFRIEIANARVLTTFDHGQWWPNLACPASPSPSDVLAVHRASAEVGDRTITPIDRTRWRSRVTQRRHERLFDQSLSDASTSEAAIAGGLATGDSPHQLKIS